MAFFILFMLGCEGDRGPAGPAGEMPVFIKASITIPHQNSEYEGHAYADVFNCIGLPEVWINEISIPYAFGHPSSNVWWTPAFYAEDFDISPGDTAHLVVEFIMSNGENGAASSDIVIPGYFAITTPEPALGELLGDSTTFNWAQSSNAVYYIIDFWIYYEHSMGNIEHSLDTLVTARLLPIVENNCFQISIQRVTFMILMGHFLYGL